MSIKDLFGKKSTKILASTNLEDFSTDVESEEYVVQELEERKLIKPDIDYTDPKNFAFYGSATKYYTDAIEGIAKKYPYDGSAAEKIKWKKQATDLQNYIFDNEYPRNNGYINIGYSYGTVSTGSVGYATTTTPEYVLIKGGPNASTETTIKNKFEKANKIDIPNNRDYNLYINGETGFTTEFWLKKDDFSGSSKQVVFDLWNSASIGSSAYGRFTIDLRDSSDISSNTSALGTTLAGEGLPRSLYVKDGFSLYIIGSGTVRQYDTSAEWNTAVLTLVNTSSITSEFTNLQAQGLSFKPDGTKLFVIGTGSVGKVVEYNLSTPWNVTTKTFVVSSSIAQDTFMNDMYMTPDGTTLFGLGDSGNRVYKYSLATPWSIATLSYTSVTASLPVGAYNALYFKDDGSRMYAGTTTAILEYNLSTPWDITTAKLVNNTSIAGTTTGISIKNEGKSLFICRFTGASPNFLGTLTSYVLPAANKVNLTIISGSTVVTSSLGNNLNITSSVWNQYAVRAFNTGSSFQTELYVNGILNDSRTFSSRNISEVTGAYIATIGSLVTAHTSSAQTSLGYGKLSGSLDEFRFWKVKRTEKDISRYWFTNINGGTNTDTANTQLGVYYKFNEGIFNTSSVDTRYDNKILDYSGRFTNGVWTGYTLGSRSTGSAIVEAGAADSENKDPVIYLTHPDVQTLLTEKQEVGTLHDNNNNAMMYYTIPAWIVEDDQKNDSNKLYELTQIIGSYFDEVFIKIKHLPSIKEVSYKNGRPFPYAMKLLESMGFATQDIFTNSSVLENLGNRNETSLYEDRLFNVKNHIYQNIYNNLSYIQKSKGTEKSIRNLLRCFGVDEELIKFNIYSNDSVYTFDDKYLNTYYKKKLVNFNDPDRVQGSVYQMTSSLDPNSTSFIQGDLELAYHGSTIEAEIVTPLSFSPSEKLYFPKNFLTSSIFGLHSADPSSPGDTTWFGSDLSSLQVYLIKPEMDSPDGYFYLTSSLGVELSSSLVRDIYTNQKWNLSLKIKHEKYPNSLKVVGGTTGSYIFEFLAINTIQDFIQSEILLTASVSQAVAESYFADSKRLYVGSHRTNFTGSILQNSDIKVSNVRYWLSYLEDDVLRQHAKDPTIYGPESPISNLETLYSGGVGEIPQNKTLALHWDFNLVTGSDNGSGTGPTNTFDGKFEVIDISSGSIANTYGIIGQITSNTHTGRGDFFFRNNSEMIENSYVSIAKHRLPENMMSSDLINILSQDDDIFTRDSRPINYFFALEKSMYQTISEEMIRFFGTITDFNNVIGKPQYRYEREYRELVKLREMFFQNVSNSPDLEKYVDYFKWIDSSITKMIYQLIPASADFSPNISDVVESHVLERNKYAWKLPSIELGAEPPITSVKTIGELKYNWKYGHAPIPLSENTNCLWWKERSERSPELDGIFQALSSAYKKKFTKVADFVTDIQIEVNKNPSNLDVIKPITKIGSGGYLEIDILKVIEKKDCLDE